MNAVVLCGLMVCMVQGARGVPQPQPNTLVSSLHSFEELNNLGPFAHNIDRFSQFNKRFYMITKDDRVYAYGKQYSSQNLFGLDGTTGESITTPTEIIELRDRKIIRFCTGDRHMLALSEDGTVYAWGNNGYGQLGVGNNVDSYRPVVVTKAKNIIDIQCNYYTSLALNADKQVLAWGENSSGECGIGSSAHQPSPVQVSLPSIVSITTTWYGTSVVVAENSQLYVWGFNTSNSPTLSPFPSIPVSVVSTYYSYFILTVHGDIYMRVMGNDPEPFFVEAIALESIYADQFSDPGFLVAKATNGSIYFWSDVSQGNNSLQLADTEDIPSTFASYEKSLIIPFMVKLSDGSEPTTTESPTTESTITTTTQPSTTESAITTTPSDDSLDHEHQVIERMFNNRMVSDVEFVFENETIYVQRSVLILTSDYMAKQFAGEWNAKISIEISRYSHRVYYLYLYFLYTNRLDATLSEAVYLDALAQDLQEEKLQQRCLEIIRHNSRMHSYAQV